MKEKAPIYHGMGHLTVLFNKWVMNAEDEKGLKRFQFKAYTNKFMVRKWMEVDLPF